MSRARPADEIAAARLGADARDRLGGLRRRLWWRRAVRSGLLVLAVALVAIALVQLVARAFPLEQARWIQLAIVGLAFIAWAADARRVLPNSADPPTGALAAMKLDRLLLGIVLHGAPPEFAPVPDRVRASRR